MVKQAKRESLDFSTVIRLPEELSNKIKSLAVKNNRSLNSEFIEIFKVALHQGKDSIDTPGTGGTDAMVEIHKAIIGLTNEMRELRQRIESVEAQLKKEPGASQESA